MSIARCKRQNTNERIDNMGRYSALITEVSARKPKIIVEIGTWGGGHAEIMINEASKYNSDVQYYGFDLFDDFVEFEKEFCDKGVAKYERVMDKLSKYNVTLIRGNTHDTLPEFNVTPDFVFLDGGHSLETIASDWKNIDRISNTETSILFDDYYHDKSDVGCKVLIDELSKNPNYSVTINSEIDSFKKDWGTLNISTVSVRKLV